MRSTAARSVVGFCVLGLAVVAPLAAQPFVYYRGIVNAASYLPAGLPNGTVAQGSMFSVFGRGIGPATPAQVSQFPLQATFAGVSIEVSQTNAGTVTRVAALPAFVSASQINAIMPSNAPLGWVSVVVTLNGVAGNPIPLYVSASAVGLFSANSGGFGPGIVQNFVSNTEQPINSLARAAKPGQTVILWGTGLGAATFPDAAAPQVTTLPIPVEIYVGGKRATVAYSGRTPCCSGIDQFVFNVPDDAPTGCYVPVVVRTRGTTVSNTVTMAIDRNGAACSDAHNPLSSGLRSGGRTALLHLAREATRVDIRVDQAFDATSETLLADFRDAAPSEFAFQALTALPPLGTCTVYSGTARRLLTAGSPLAPAGAAVDPGSPLSLEAGANRQEIAANSGFPGSFTAPLDPAKPVLNLGSISVSAPGSAAASAFRLLLDAVNPVNWTNRDQQRAISRNSDLALAWTNSPAGSSRGVAILGRSQRLSYGAAGGFLCLAPPGASSFTIPSYVLQAMPGSDAREPYPSAQIAIGNVPLANPSGVISGFPQAFLGVSNWVSKTVTLW